MNALTPQQIQYATDPRLRIVYPEFCNRVEQLFDGHGDAPLEFQDSAGTGRRVRTPFAMDDNAERVQ